MYVSCDVTIHSSIHPFGLRETIREKGGERGRKGEKGGERGRKGEKGGERGRKGEKGGERGGKGGKGGKDAGDISRKCIGERKDWNGETLNCFARENKWHIDVCYGSDFLAQKSRLATISSPTSSSYAYKI